MSPSVPVMVFVVLGGLWLLPESRSDKGIPIDLVSAVLSVTAIMSVIYAIKVFAHDGPTVLSSVSLLAGIAAGGVFLRRQRALTAPLIDIDLFKRPAFTWAIVATVLAVFALSGLLYFFSQYLQLVRGYPTLRAGMTEIPASLASIAIDAVVATTVRRLGNGRALGEGLIMAAAGLIVVAVAESWGGIVLICVGLLVIGAGLGLAFTVSTGAVLGSVPADRAGAASAISETGLELGVALGIAVLGTIQDVGYRVLIGRSFADVPDRVADAARQSLANLSGAVDAFAPDQAQLLSQARDAFTQAMQMTAVVAAAILLLAGAMAWRYVPAADPLDPVEER